MINLGSIYGDLLEEQLLLEAKFNTFIEEIKNLNNYLNLKLSENESVKKINSLSLNGITLDNLYENYLKEYLPLLEKVNESIKSDNNLDRNTKGTLSKKVKGILNTINVFINNKNIIVSSYKQLFNVAEGCASDFLKNWLKSEGYDNDELFLELSFVGSNYLDLNDIFNYINKNYPQLSELNSKFNKQYRMFYQTYNKKLDKEHKNLLYKIVNEDKVGCYKDMGPDAIYDIITKINKNINPIYYNNNKQSFYGNAILTLGEMYETIRQQPKEKESVEEKETDKEKGEQQNPYELSADFIKSIMNVPANTDFLFKEGSEFLKQYPLNDKTSYDRLKKDSKNVHLPIKQTIDKFLKNHSDSISDNKELHKYLAFYINKIRAILHTLPVIYSSRRNFILDTQKSKNIKKKLDIAKKYIK